MTKPDCRGGTSCGMACISSRYDCKSRVNGGDLIQLVQPPGLLSTWSKSFDKSPSDVRRVLADLDEPEFLNPGSSERNAYANAQGIHMGSKLDPGKVSDQYIFRHELGHYIDHAASTAASKAARHSDFEHATNGTTVFDIQYLADKYGTSIGKQLDKEAERLGYDKDVMFDLYMAATSSTGNVPGFDGQPTSYVSSTKVMHDALRDDEQDLLAKMPKTDKDRNAIRMQVAKSLTAERITETANELASQDTLPGHLVRRALSLGHTPDPRFMLAVLSQDPNRLATEADRLLNSGATVRDLAGALTGNVVGSGHSDEYYAKGLPYRKRNTETFANLFSLHSSGDPLAQKVAEYMSPKAYNVLKALLTD